MKNVSFINYLMMIKNKMSSNFAINKLDINNFAKMLDIPFNLKTRDTIPGLEDIEEYIEDLKLFFKKVLKRSSRYTDKDGNERLYDLRNVDPNSEKEDLNIIDKYDLLYYLSEPDNIKNYSLNMKLAYLMNEYPDRNPVLIYKSIKKNNTANFINPIHVSLMYSYMKTRIIEFDSECVERVLKLVEYIYTKLPLI